MKNKEKIFKQLKDYKKKLENLGYNVVYIGLYGSQNYSFDDEQSDVDCRAIIIPSLHDIIFRVPTSKIYEFETGEVDVKDLLTFYDVIRKGNFTYCEAIDTKYSIGDKYLKDLFKQIKPNLMSMYGVMLEKKKALTHEYPSKKREFEQFGYDPKQLHHIIRLYDLIYSNIWGDEMTGVESNYTISYIDYFLPDKTIDGFDMLKLKRTGCGLTRKEAEKIAEQYVEEAKLKIPKDYKYVPIDLSKEVGKYLENKLKSTLINNCKYMSARQIRTFDQGISKKDIEKFPILEQYKDKDISYIVYEYLELL